MKRKDLEEVFDEFMDFSLSSPARKMRRLDANEWPPTMDLVETASALAFDDAVSCASDIVTPSWESVREVSPPYPSNNEERAIVLYKPVESPLFLSPDPTNFSLRVTSDLIRGLKSKRSFTRKEWILLSEKSPLDRGVFADHVLNPGNQRFHAEDEETEADSSSLAIVPWAAPSQAAMAISGFASSQPQSQPVHEPMETEDAEVITSMSMQVEDLRQAAGGEGFQQVLQHCMLLPNPDTSSPIMRSW